MILAAGFYDVIPQLPPWLAVVVSFLYFSDGVRRDRRARTDKDSWIELTREISQRITDNTSALRQIRYDIRDAISCNRQLSATLGSLDARVQELLRQKDST